MTSHKKVAYLILLSTFTLSSAATMQAQNRWPSTNTRQTYTPPPAPRVERQEPQRQPETRQYSQPETRTYSQPENRQYSQPENRQTSQPETRTYSQPGNQYNNSQTQVRTDSGLGHTNTNVIRPQTVSQTMRHAMTYNKRANGVHIMPEYFAGHYGRDHGFHFNGWGPNCPTCGFTLFNGEWYFNWNGGNFGLMSLVPGNWALATDYLYIDIGDDGNYYLYDAQNPDVAVQLTFVQNLGDDQAGADQDQSDGQ